MMVFRDASSKHASDLLAPMRPTDVSRLGSILPTIRSSLAAPSQPVLLTLPTCRSLKPRLRMRHAFAAVFSLAGRHQLPGDAGNLVGERHCRSFGGLRLKCKQPRRRIATTVPTCRITTAFPPPMVSNVSSPARVILPSRVLPAVEWSLGSARSKPQSACLYNARCIRRLHHQRRGASVPHPTLPSVSSCSVARCQATSLPSIAFNSTCSCA